MKTTSLVTAMLVSFAAPALAAKDPPRDPPAAASQGTVAKKAQVGMASWYGRTHAGRRTASGERFDPQAMTCAHRTLPLGSVVTVTNVATGQQVSLTVNDRGPYMKGRIVDLSEKAARQLGVGDRGVILVRLEVVGADTPA